MKINEIIVFAVKNKVIISKRTQYKPSEISKSGKCHSSKRQIILLKQMARNVDLVAVYLGSRLF